MAGQSRRFPVIRDSYPELEEEMGRLSISRGVAYPMEGPCQNRPAEPIARVNANYLLLKNEIYDLFREFYKRDGWNFVLNSSLGGGMKFPILNLIAGKVRFDLAEDRYYMPSPSTFDSSEGYSD